MKTINFQFEIESYDSNTKALTVNVLANSNDTLRIFGINLRLFFDARLFTLMDVLPIDNYREYNRFVNTSSTGWAMFGSTGAITYLNTAIEALNEEVPEISSTPSKIATLKLKLKDGVSGVIFPEFILDKQINYIRGSFIPNSDGITAVEMISATQTASLIETVDHLNWKQNPIATRFPWGSKIQEEFITV